MKVPSVLTVIICLVLLMAQCSGKGKLLTKSRTDLNDRNIIYQFRILEKKNKNKIVTNPRNCEFLKLKNLN